MKKEIGKRLKLARQMTNLTRKQFADKHNLNYHTLESWEQGINNISDENLSILESILTSEGINVSKNWILNGNVYESLNSTIKNQNQSKVHSNYSLDGDFSYLREIKFFQETTENAIVTMILDDALFPYFNKGDYVGGVVTISKAMEQYVGKFCIIKMKNNDIIARKVVSFKNEDITICSINPNATLNTPDYYTIPFNKIALITRHWLCGLLANDDL